MEQEFEKEICGQDDDFKYVMLDAGNIFIGARLSYAELMKQEMLPFKVKAIIEHYFMKETTSDTTLESQLYYLEKDSFLYQTLDQLKVRVKVNMLVEKKSLFGKRKQVYQEKIFKLNELVDMNLAQKKGSEMIIREVMISKLALMAFMV